MKKNSTKFMLVLTVMIFSLFLMPAGTGNSWAEEEEQRFEDYMRNIKISQEFLKAKALDVPPVKTLAVPEPEPRTHVLTPEEIIDGFIKAGTESPRMDLDFDATELGVIIMTVGNVAQINVALDPELKGRQMDLHLKQVSAKEALLILGDSYNLGFKRIGDCLFISSKQKLRDQKLVSRVIRLRNISADQAKMMVKDLSAVINISDEINSLMVVGEPEEIIKVEAVLEKIDKPQAQVVLEAKIIEVNKDALRELGVDWSDEISIGYQEKGRPVEFSNVENTAGQAFKIFSMSRNPIQFNTTLKMLEQMNKAKVLSSPRVTTMNNKTAEIFVGDRIPYTVTTISGGVATSDVRFEEPGIRLKITPSIIENDFVVIKVEPEVSFIYSFRGPDDAYPWTKKRQATANVRVKDQQPFVLGGLLTQEDKKNLYKVPFLGSMPLLGNLFKWESKTAVDTELIITVIPTVVQGGN